MSQKKRDAADLRLRLLTNPTIFGGVFRFSWSRVEVFALLSDDGQQLCQSDNQKPE